MDQKACFRVRNVKTIISRSGQITLASAARKGKNALALQIKGEANGDNTLATLRDIEFHNGVIEAIICEQLLANAGETARGFVPITWLRCQLGFWHNNGSVNKK